MMVRSAVVLSFAAVCAAGPVPAGAQMALNDGDTVVFLGNGVTQQHQFAWMTEAFLRLRYPERKIRFLNAAHAGDTAEKAAARLKDEVLVHKPTVAVVCFGLYEGEFLPWHAYRPKYEKFKTDLRRLLDALAAAKVRVVLCSPTPVDADRKYQGRDLKTYNQVMLKYADNVRREAEGRRLLYADLINPLLAADGKGSSAKPAWTVFDEKTGILLNAQGHLVVAAQLLKALAANDQVGRVAGEFKDGELRWWDLRPGGEPGRRRAAKWHASGGAVLALEDVRRPVPLFDFPGIPGPLPVAGQIPAAAAMNEIKLALSGLPADRDYHLRLDGRPVGTFSAKELAGGVKLVAQAAPPARTLLDDDLERLWAGIAYKDSLHLKRADPAVRKDKSLHEKVEREFEDVSRRLDEMNARLARPMSLAVLPGVKTDPKGGPPAEAAVRGATVRCLLGARYYLLCVPPEVPAGAPPPPLLVWMHTDREPPEQWEPYFRKLADERKIIVALPCAWHTEWRPGDDAAFLREQVAAPLAKCLKADPARVVFAGHGTGGSMACTLVFTDPGAVRAAMAVSAVGLAKLPAPKPGVGPVFLIHGGNDPVEPVAAAAALEDRLRRAGVTVMLKRHDRERRIPEGALEEGLKFLLESAGKTGP